MKKCIAVLSALALLLCAFPLTALAEEKKPEVDTSLPPVIFIDGINSSDLVRDMGKKEEEKVFPFEAGDVVPVIQENAAAVWDMLDGDYTAENEATVLNAVLDFLDGLAMNDDGTSKYDISADWVYPGQVRPHYTGDDAEQPEETLMDKLSQLRSWFSSLFQEPAEQLTEEELFRKMLERRSTYKFTYDWRLDMFVIAEQLHDYIEYMKELTGHETVALVGFSQGAAVLNTYLTVYGFDGLESVIWCCGAQNGVELVGQIFTGRVRVDAAALTSYIRENDGTDLLSEIITCFAEALKAIGVTGNLLEYTNRIIAAVIADGGLRTVLRQTFAKMPSIWSLISDKYYEEAKAYVFNEPGDAETYAELIETIDRYHYGVQAHSAELMAQARSATGRIGVIAKYGLRVTPLMQNDSIQADGLIDVAATSCGATAAEYGKTLGDGYVQKVQDGHNHISADRVIDASTCLYPEYTWFIKNMPHSTLTDYPWELFSAIAHADGQFTVHDDPDFPQFVVYEPIEGECTPLKENSSSNAFTRAVLRIRVFLRNLLERVKHFFGKD